MATLVVLLVPAALAPGAPSRSCARDGARVVATRGQTRIVVLRSRHYACWSATGRRTVLESTDGDCETVFVRSRASAGEYLAVEDTAGCAGGGIASRQLEVINARIGVAKPYGAGLGEGGVFTAVVLSGSGVLAYIARSYGASYRYEVGLSGERAARLVDTGPGIVPDSLRRSGNRVSWRHGDQQRSAVLA